MTAYKFSLAPLHNDGSIREVPANEGFAAFEAGDQDDLLYVVHLHVRVPTGSGYTPNVVGLSVAPSRVALPTHLESISADGPLGQADGLHYEAKYIGALKQGSTLGVQFSSPTAQTAEAEFEVRAAPLVLE
jgi:hypothetical protein